MVDTIRLIKNPNLFLFHKIPLPKLVFALETFQTPNLRMSTALRTMPVYLNCHRWLYLSTVITCHNHPLDEYVKKVLIIPAF